MRTIVLGHRAEGRTSGPPKERSKPSSPRNAGAFVLAMLVASALLVADPPPLPTAPAAAAAGATAFVDINPDTSAIVANPGLGIAACPDPCPYGGSGGRVNGLAAVAGNPGTYFAASELGGLFKTTDAGASWSHVDGYLPTRTWDVAAAPGGQTVYATAFYDGRVDSGAGVQVSKDGGSTWADPLTALDAPPGCHPFRAAQPSGFGIAVRPGSSEVLAGTNCGIARSTDGGSTWAQSDPSDNGVGPNNVWDIVALPGGWTYACGDDGLLWSPDGATWTTPTPDKALSGFCSLAVSPDEPNVVYAVFATPGFGQLFVAGNGNFFEGVVQFDAGTATSVHWSDPLPHPDASFGVVDQAGNPTRKNRVPFVVTNDRSGPGFDLWLGDGNLFRVPCTAGGGSTTPRCTTDITQWYGTFTDGLQEHDKAHGDAGDLEFDPTTTIDACPTLFSSDGGIYRNASMQLPQCQGTNPVLGSLGKTDPGTDFLPANVGVHAQLLWGMAGVDRSSSLAEEDIYFATQDVGMFGTLRAGEAKPTWEQASGGDVFGVVADDTRVVASAFELWAGDAGLKNMNVVVGNPPWGTLIGGRALSEIVAEVGKAPCPGPPGTGPCYMIASQGYSGSGPPVSRGVFVTNDIENSPLGNVLGTWGSARAPCDIKVAAGQPYVQTGVCDWANPDELWTFDPALSDWRRILPPAGTDGFSLFAVDPKDATRLYGAVVGAGEPRMVRSTNGGTTWTDDEELTRLMHGGGRFAARPQNAGDGVAPYPQPTLVAFDPEDPDILVAGGRESGVFVSSDGGASWAVVTDPLGTSDAPHLPRPHFAHFDHEPVGRTHVYIGTVGRGVWRIELATADLSVAKTDAPDPVPNGQPLTYTVTARNHGPDTAGNLRVTDRLPAGVSFVSAVPTHGACSEAAGVVACEVPSLAPGASVSVAITVVPTQPGTMVNTARVSGAVIDPNPGDNLATQSTTVLPSADLAVRKTDSPDPVLVGETLTYTVAVVNDGPDAAAVVTVKDTLPATVTLVSASPSQGSCTPTPPTVACGLGSLGAGEGAVVTLRVLPTDKGLLTNTASVASATFEPDPGDNVASAATTVLALVGGAFGEKVDVTTVLGAKLASGPAPSVTLPKGGGGPLTRSLASAGVGGVLHADALRVSTEGGRAGSNLVVVSSADVSKATIGSGVVVAEGVHSECRADLAGATGTARVARLVVNGAVVTVAAGSTVSIPGVGTLVVNERLGSGTGTLTVNALRLRLSGVLGTGDVVVAQSRCGVDR